MTDLQTILDAGKVIPVLAYNSIDEAPETSRTLYDMGIRVFEITLRHPTALEALHTPLAPSVPAPRAGDQVRAGDESGCGGCGVAQ